MFVLVKGCERRKTDTAIIAQDMPLLGFLKDQLNSLPSAFCPTQVILRHHRSVLDGGESPVTSTMACSKSNPTFRNNVIHFSLGGIFILNFSSTSLPTGNLSWHFPRGKSDISPALCDEYTFGCASNYFPGRIHRFRLSSQPCRIQYANVVATSRTTLGDWPNTGIARRTGGATIARTLV